MSFRPYLERLVCEPAQDIKAVVAGDYDHAWTKVVSHQYQHIANRMYRVRMSIDSYQQADMHSPWSVANFFGS